jgi:hypothetical protein
MRIIILVILFFSSLLHLGAGEEQLSELDKEIIKFFREEEIGTGATDYPDLKTYYEKLDWYRDQGQKARPALMYLLTEFYEGDFHNMSRTMKALFTMDGDRSDILDYVRNKLPEIDGLEDTPGKSGYIQVSLLVLGKFGTQEDMELTRAFLNHPDVLVRSTAMTQQRNLQARIDAGEFDKPDNRRKPGSNASEGNHQESSDLGSSDDDKTDGKNEIDSKIGLILGVLAAFLAVALFLWKKLRTADDGAGHNN